MRNQWTTALISPATSYNRKCQSLIRCIADNSDAKTLYDVLFGRNLSNDYHATTVVPLMHAFDLFVLQCVKWKLQHTKKSSASSESMSNKEKTIIMCRFVTTLNEFERSGTLTLVSSKQKDNLYKCIMTWL